MRELHIYLKSCLKASLFDCKIKTVRICTLSDIINNAQRYQPLTWAIVYCVAKCTDTPNLIFAIKQGGFETTFDIYNSLIAQLA